MGLVRVSVQLAVVEARYALVYSVRFTPNLPKGERLASRAPRSLFMRIWQLGRSKANGSWEHAIDVSPLVRRRLSATQLDCLAALSKLGHLATDGGTLTFRCFDLEVGSPRALDDLVGVASALARASAVRTVAEHRASEAARTTNLRLDSRSRGPVHDDHLPEGRARPFGACLFGKLGRPTCRLARGAFLQWQVHRVARKEIGQATRWRSGSSS